MVKLWKWMEFGDKCNVSSKPEPATVCFLAQSTDPVHLFINKRRCNLLLASDLGVIDDVLARGNRMVEEYCQAFPAVEGIEVGEL
ncbi:hypothetical protein V6N13_060325 [Hibiscus sabdariffa]|uniref:Uncharacterized protein n=2 Tax=Hibiscus sabdariffa TaxID=183260 RepID=A0ABR2GAD7_9ROSI